MPTKNIARPTSRQNQEIFGLTEDERQIIQEAASNLENLTLEDLHTRQIEVGDEDNPALYTNNGITYIKELMIDSKNFEDAIKLFRHTIVMTGTANQIFSMTFYAKSNEIIDSLTDLFTVIGNTDVAGYGINGANTFLMIHIDTTSSNTTFLQQDNTSISLAASGLTSVVDYVTLVD